MSNVKQYDSVPNKYTYLTKTKMRTFLKLIEQGESIASAAEMIGVNRGTIYHNKKKNPKFNEDIKRAKERFVESLEAELHNRIFNGSSEETYDGEGNLIKVKKSKSDALLLKKLEAEKPEKYGRKSTNVNINEHKADESSLMRLAQLLQVELPEKQIEKKHQDSIEAQFEYKDDDN